MNNHEKLINKANTFIKEKLKENQVREYQPVYHFTAPTGWLNDPNGLIQHKGIYHLFYQFHPYSADWGPMHWGHATSTDLVNWQHQPVALAPSEDYEVGKPGDGYGCFSGSAVEKDGELYLLYTGHIESNDPKEVQCLATTKDGIHFDKHPNNPIIEKPDSLDHDFRDPKVWLHEGTWYMVIGTNHKGRGAIALFTSADLTNWEYCGPAAESDGSLGDMWECPDLFPIQNKHALIFSPMRNGKHGNALIQIGDMDYNKKRFTKDYFVEIDHGFDLYAPQTFLDDKGRRILISWMDHWSSKFPTKEEGWAGAMTIPREIKLDNKGQVRFHPVEELKKLRQNEEKYTDLNFTNTFSPSIKGQSLEIKSHFDLSSTNSTTFGLKVLKSDDGKEFTEIMYDARTNKVTVDLNQSGQVTGIASADVSNDQALTLHLYIDRCSVELFINDGESVITNRVYPRATSDQIEFFGTDDVLVKELNIWNLDK